MRRPLAVALAPALALALVGCSGSAPGPEIGPGERPSTMVTTAPSTTVAVDPAIADLIDGAGMTSSGRVIFLASQPVLEDKETLAMSCAGAVVSNPDVLHVLGCLVRGRIHLRLPSAPALHDLLYVAAAHELLHAVYAGLGTSERQLLVTQLQAARAANPVIDEQLRFYGAVSIDTETHSLAGTEIVSVSGELQAHYAKYFDRARVVAAYRRTLGDRDDELRRQRAVLDESQARLDTMRAEIDALRAAGNSRAANALVDEFNALANQHNEAAVDLNARVDERNKLLRS